MPSVTTGTRLTLPATLQHSYDTLPQAIWCADAHGQLGLINRAWTAFTGLQATQVLGQSIGLVIHPDDRPATLTRWTAACREAQPFSLECRMQRADGTYRHTLSEVHPHRDDDGRLLAWVAVSTDIQGHVQAAAELTQQCATLQNIVDANADCIKVLDLDARLLSMNMGGLRAMEVDDFHTCLNAAWPTFWHGDVRPQVDAALDQARSGHVGSFEGFCPTMKGTPKWWEVTLSPMRDQHGQVVNLLATSRDITARKRAEDDLRELNATLEAHVQARTEALGRTVEQLRRSNTELERFAYIAAHDLQEPIRTVNSFADALQRRYHAQLDERGQQYLDFIGRGAARMKTLVDDLLAYSRLNGNHLPLTPVKTEEPLREALARLHARLTDAGAQVTHDPLPTVLADAPQLVQVFQNLISNGVKFSRPDVPPRIHLSATRQAQEWHFTVQDNGIGLEPAYLKRIFEMFQRLHSRDQHEGTGLGLSICRKIIEGHGGRIWAESTPGQGSTFHFTLKAVPDVQVVPEAPAEP